MDGTMRMPLARDEGLVIEELGEELLVYDLDVKHAHCLTPTAARVWRVCDGRTPPPVIASSLGLDVGEVSRALDDLSRCELLAPKADSGAGYSRREFGFKVAKVGVATATVPLILSVAAPAAGQGNTACLALDKKTGPGCPGCQQQGENSKCCCCHFPTGGADDLCLADHASCCAMPGGPTHCTESGNVDNACP